MRPVPTANRGEIESMWEDYATSALTGFHQTQIDAMQAAFFAGASVLVKHVKQSEQHRLIAEIDEFLRMQRGKYNIEPEEEIAPL